MSAPDPKTIEQLAQWQNTVSGKTHITLRTTGHPEDKAFKTLAGQLTAHAPSITIQHQTHDRSLPGFMLTENIGFHALPMERELAPFLDALSMMAGTETAAAAPLREKLSKIDIPVHLKLYIALMCPHCPGMVRTLIPLALATPLIRLEIIDGSLFPDSAGQDRVTSAPCLILDDGFRWTGSVPADQILEMILNRDPGALSVASLKNILEQGEASWITEQMIGAGTIFNAFIGLLLHDTWSVRLGAMVVVEELAEKAPALALTLCPRLTAAFDEADIPVQGDILYALGEAGGPQTAQWITGRMKTLRHPDLIESAQDALDTIKERHG